MVIKMAYKILIIDDDTELLKMLRRYFEIKKYEIIEFLSMNPGMVFDKEGKRRRKLWAEQIREDLLSEYFFIQETGKNCRNGQKDVSGLVK